MRDIALVRAATDRRLRGALWLSACDEGDHDVGGVAVEVLTAAVVDRRGPWIRMACCELHVAEWDAGVEGGHDERGAQHVRVDVAEPGPFAGASDLSVG